MPLAFWNNRIACVVTGEVFGEPDGYVFIYHEFIHCAQWDCCEQRLKEGLARYLENRLRDVVGLSENRGGRTRPSPASRSIAAGINSSASSSGADLALLSVCARQGSGEPPFGILA